MNMERGMKRFKKKQRSKNASVHPSKEELEIAKHVRFKTPRKSTVIKKQSVEYFIGSKAVDVLMASKWANRKKADDYMFSCREDAAYYLDELLQKKFFYRAMKNEAETKSKQDEKNSDDEMSKQAENETKEEAVGEVQEPKVRRRKKGKVTENGTEADQKNKEKNKTKEKKTKEKVKKRYKLSVHTEQKFRDSKDIYIWLYNPVSPKTIIMGLGVLLCVVAATLFPLWPPQVRIGVYYASLGGGIFIGSIFVLALARSILYGLLWVFSGGKHHLWILPNILADVGFFDSFKPFYTYEYKGSKTNEEKSEEDDSTAKASGSEGDDSQDDKVEEEEEDVENATEEDAPSDQKPNESESTAESNTESIPS